MRLPSSLSGLSVYALYLAAALGAPLDNYTSAQEKLARNGLRGGSIPVLDVRGKVMIGFNPAEVDAALGAML